MAAVVAALLLLLSSLAMQSAVARFIPLPVVARVSQDRSTGLYLISVRNSESNPLVLDLAGPLLWWPCLGFGGQEKEHPIPCSSGTCRVANRNHPPNCPYVDGGKPEASCHCTAYPYNPVNGKCGSGGLTRETLWANTTDGRRPLYPVSFRAVASCAPYDLPYSSFPDVSLEQGQRPGRNGVLPSRYPYPGVAGLSRSPLSLPSQVAAERMVSSKFTLCLPHVAIFGGGPVHIPGSADDVETVTEHLSRTRLVRNPRNSAYYIDVAGIAVNGARVALPDGALTISSQGQGGVALSTVTPYTALRPDIYRAVLAAFDAVTAGLPRVSQAPKPLERCFDLTAMNQMGTWKGSLPVAVDLMLTDGKNWTFTSLSATHEVVPQTLCFAFVEMGAGSVAAYAVPDSPAVVIGGHQMENNLLEFDLEKGALGYTGLMSDKRMGACSNFNWARPSA